MPCRFFEPDIVCEHVSKKGRCKKFKYPEGHPFCGQDKVLLALIKQNKKEKKKLNWKKFK